MRLRYTPEAVSDIRELRRYIKHTLRNPVAAERISNAILRACSSLKTFPNLGVSVEGRTGFATDLRMLFCENWIAVYRIEPDSDVVSIARILDGRQDYIHILFGEAELDTAMGENKPGKEH